jgi:hypothetical protein
MTAFTWKLAAATVAAVCAATAVTAAVIGFSAPPAPAPAPVAPAIPLAAPAPAKKDAGERVADAAQRANSKNNLKQILIAMHNYHDAVGHFPRNIADKTGKPLLSWRVAILPYIDHEHLYKEFKLDEPWDSANNKPLLAKMPRMLRVGFEPKGETKTYYQGFAGPGTMFDPEKKVALVSITDGSSNTLTVVEAGPPVEWTRPMDIPYDPKNPLPELDGPFSNTLIAAVADGSAHTLRRDLDEKTLRRLIETADGNVVSTEDARATFPLTAEDLKAIAELVKENEGLIAAVSEQFKEQQKAVLESVNRPNANGNDLERLLRMNRGLKFALESMKKETAELKKALEGLPPVPEPPAVKK